RMTKPLVVIDADVLGRRRTGDETYVEQLLRVLPDVADDLRFAAVTRRPELVPDGVEALHLPARSQELRMAWAVPRLVRRVRPEAGGRRLVVVGRRRDEAPAGEPRQRGADLRGYVDKAELVSLYRQAACLVFPSRYEGFGLPVVEAIASGTPAAALGDPAVR